MYFFSVFLKILFIFSFRERGREGEREGDSHRCVRDRLIGCLSHAPSCGPGPQHRHVPCDWESNQRPFSSQTGAQSVEPHQPGNIFLFRSKCIWVQVLMFSYFQTKRFFCRPLRVHILYHFLHHWAKKYTLEPLLNYRTYIVRFILAWFLLNILAKGRKNFIACV